MQNREKTIDVRILQLKNNMAYRKKEAVLRKRIFLFALIMILIVIVMAVVKFLG